MKVILIIDMNLKRKVRFLVPFILIVVRMIQNLWSSDRATRRMSLIFLLSFIGLVSVSLTLLVHLFWRYPTGSPKTLDLSAGVQNQASSVERPPLEVGAFVSLGSVLIDLKSKDESALRRKLKNVAQIELYLHCDSLKTKTLLMERAPQVKDMILNVFVGVSSDDLQSMSGKKRLKSLILQKVNSWLPSGKVDEVLLSQILFV